MMSFLYTVCQGCLVSTHSTDKRGGVSSCSLSFKERHAPKCVAENRAVFDEVKGCCFTHFNQSMLQTLH